MDNLISFPGTTSTSPEPLSTRPHVDVRPITEWLKMLRQEQERKQHVPKTIQGYNGLFEQFLEFVEEKPGGEHGFYPQLMTETAVQEFFYFLRDLERSPSTLNKAKCALQIVVELLQRDSFHEPLSKDPLKYVKIPPQKVRPARVLTDRQRYIFKSLVEREGTPRGAALFALAYHVGLRISEPSHLRLDEVIGRIRWMGLIVGHKNEKKRQLQITSAARNPLQFYLHGKEPGCRSTSSFADSSPYVFVSKRSERFTESGVYQWFQALKKSAPVDWYAEIEDVKWHDFRHDFAHRMRHDKGWTLEEVALYLGHTTKSGTLSLQTTMRYTMPSEEDFRKRIEQLE